MSDTENEGIENTENTVNIVKSGYDEPLEKQVNTAPLEKPANASPLVMKKKLNLSDAERERRRQSMLVARQKLKEKKEQEKQEQEQYLKKREQELVKKVTKKVAKLENKKSKEIYKSVIVSGESDDEVTPQPKTKKQREKKESQVTFTMNDESLKPQVQRHSQDFRPLFRTRD